MAAHRHKRRRIVTATHYEKAVSLIESHGHAVDSNRRDPEWEQQLLHLALVHAVLDVAGQIARIAEHVEQIETSA